ncbi:hypothetical protein [Streptomyces sp. TR06-5]|uniref:hypothetical protein n=1 Tax=Streptomyces sp. TR06-5 TaxID=3385976 RepID=UPI00399EFD0C
MSDLLGVARNLRHAVDGVDIERTQESAREFIEEVTFSTPEEILAMLREVLSEDWMGLPPWARNLAYRLACLQRPDDSELLREAAADLLCFGPDWDDVADQLKERAAQLDS